MFYVIIPPRIWTAQTIVAYSVKGVSCEAEGIDEWIDLYGLG